MNCQRLALTFVALSIVACQKSAQNLNGASSETFQSASAQCQSGDSENVSIEGLKNLKSGQKTLLSLSSGVNCKQAQKAVWKIGESVLGTGPSIEATISGTGLYRLSVDLGADLTGRAQNKTLSPSTVSALVAVTDSQILVVGPQGGLEDQPYSFSLAVPAGTEVVEAQWDFGDGSPLVSSLNPVSHSFSQGLYTVKVQIRDSANRSQSLEHAITILPIPEGGYCPLDQLDITGPTQVPVGRRVTYSVSLSDCLKAQVTQIKWTFGDGISAVTTQTVQHVYQAVGSYRLTAQVFLNGTSINLIRDIVVSDTLDQLPGPITENPNQCTTAGATRTSQGTTSTRTIACGLNGTRVDTYQEQVVETCTAVNQVLTWVETSRTPVLITAGSCTGQSCELTTEKGIEILKDGESRSLYTSKLPVGSCSQAQVSRVCQNGTLTGSNSAQFLTCQSGCGDFGVHGTTVLGVVTGESSQTVTCPFGETGVISIYHQISDRTCQDGQITSSNTRLGDLKTAGVCPTYSWVATETWSQCSADCGGEQTRVYECRSPSGAVAPSERCTNAAPVERRVCDGNPQAAARMEATATSEEAPSCATCPKNQIGVVVQKRDVTTSKVYACVNHQVQLVDIVLSRSAWTTESYCRDYVPMRCSHDSLSLSQASGRKAWMEKCQEQVPAVKEFLSRLSDLERETSSYGRTRPLYPTFMNAETKKAWVAPTSAKAACEAPAQAYVAAVCVASCSTPEQQILVDAQNEKKWKYMPFIQALTEKADRVGTLHSASNMSSKTLQSTKVDNWVTELLDEEHPILIFKMQSGGQLKVTVNHPILSEEGVMKFASDYKVGEALVQVGGKLDPIVSIEPAVHHGKVYNLFVKSNDLKQNVVVINGYLNGTAFYQNEGAKFLNRALFRKNLFRGAFEGKEKR